MAEGTKPVFPQDFATESLQKRLEQLDQMKKLFPPLTEQERISWMLIRCELRLRGISVEDSKRLSSDDSVI